MKFKMNDCDWTIEELSQEEIKKEMQRRYEQEIEEEPTKCGRYFGVTFSDTQVIFLDKDLPQDRKKKTLLHELTHCYIACFITHRDKTYEEEDVADIVANSHNTICEIVNRYFSKEK